jgi:AcrR family transcriptional regulator
MNAAATPRRSHAERSAATQAQVLDAAARVVLTRSFQAATMFEVAKEAGVTPGALQHHFGSKAELMLQLLERQLHAQGEEALAWPDAKLPLPQRTQALLQALWQGLYEPPRFLVAWGVYFGSVGDEALRERIVARRAKLQDTVREHFLASLPELAQAADAQAFIDMVLSCLRGMGVVRLFAPQPEACAAQLHALAMVIEQRCASVLPAPTSRGKTSSGKASRAAAPRKPAPASSKPNPRRLTRGATPCSHAFPIAVEACWPQHCWRPVPRLLRLIPSGPSRWWCPTRPAVRPIRWAASSRATWPCRCRAATSSSRTRPVPER